MVNRVSASAVAAVAAFIATGCSTIYEPPSAAGQGTARFRVGQLDDALQTLPYVLADKCLTSESIPGKEKYITLFGHVKSPDKRLRDSLGMPGAPEIRDNFHETRIPAGREFNFQFYRALSGGGYYAAGFANYTYKVCKVGFSFLPEVGADYEVMIESRSTSCNVSLNRLVVTSNRVERLPVAATRIDASTCGKR